MPRKPFRMKPRRAAARTCSSAHLTGAWLEKAEQLQGTLAHLKAAPPADAGVVDSDEQEAMKRLTIARWLRAEFSDEPPEDTATLALFPEESARFRGGAIPAGCDGGAALPADCRCRFDHITCCAATSRAGWRVAHF